MGVKIDYVNKIDTSAINPINPNEGIDVVYLTGAGYIDYPFRGISRDSALGWEEAVWGGELTRSASDFVMTNITDVNYGLVARLELSYKYMNVAEYKVLMEISKQRVCYATYFNREKGKWIVRQEMAFTGNELGKLYAFGEDYIGTMDVKIKLVATNREKTKENLTVKLHLYNPYFNVPEENAIITCNVEWSDNINLKEATKDKWSQAYADSDIFLDYFSDNPFIASEKKYLPNQDLTIFNNTSLYAIWGTNIQSNGFANDSWETISIIAKSGHPEKYYNIGDEKEITIKNENREVKIILVILDFRKDYITDNGDQLKSSITIGTKELLDSITRFYYPHDFTYMDNAINTMLMDDTLGVFKQLPADLQSIIKPVKKTTMYKSETGTHYTTQPQKLWLLSLQEIVPSESDYPITAYKYWKSIKNGDIAINRVKTLTQTQIGNTSTPFNWLLRDRNDDNNSFYIITDNGDISYLTDTTEVGLCFGFCI